MMLSAGKINSQENLCMNELLTLAYFSGLRDDVAKLKKSGVWLYQDNSLFSGFITGVDQ